VPNATDVDAGDHEVAIIQLSYVLLRRRRDSLAPAQVDGAAAEWQQARCVRSGLSALGADVLHTFPVDATDICDDDSGQLFVPFPRSVSGVWPAPRKACNSSENERLKVITGFAAIDMQGCFFRRREDASRSIGILDAPIRAAASWQ
jgi:hypothetical protein